jgi:hypothetical protein
MSAKTASIDLDESICKHTAGTFVETSMPVVDYYRKQGKVVDVSSSSPPSFHTDGELRKTELVATSLGENRSNPLFNVGKDGVDRLGRVASSRCQKVNRDVKKSRDSLPREMTSTRESLSLPPIPRTTTRLCAA